MLLLYLQRHRIVFNQLRFTFHYASTLSRPGYCYCPNRRRIYIPLCFYFIRKPPARYNRVNGIYIPLCFYFIAFAAFSYSSYSSFTFHYASTLSGLNSRWNRKLTQFTFHYASTLSRRGRAPVWVLDPIYIPLCFYFISCRIGSYRLSFLIYIPLCFYFILFQGAAVREGY